MRCRSAPQHAKPLKIVINRCLHLPLPMTGNGMLTHTMRARIYARGRTITNLILKIGSIGLGIGKEHCIATSIVIALIWHRNADRSSANRANMILITTSVYVVPYMDPSKWIAKARSACHSCRSCSSCRFTVSISSRDNKHHHQNSDLSGFRQSQPAVPRRAPPCLSHIT